jgi:hypothetical protein
VKAGARARQRGPFKDTKLGTFPIGASSLFVSSSTGFDEIDEFFSPPTRAMASNKEAKIGNRDITDEPMYLLFNVGMSENFVRPPFIPSHRGRELTFISLPGLRRLGQPRICELRLHL